MRNGLDVFTYEGALVETLPKELGMPSTGARVPDVTVPALTLAQARPRRNGQLSATAAQSQVAVASAPHACKPQWLRASWRHQLRRRQRECR